VQDRPEAVDTGELGRLLASRWELPDGQLSYLPVGHGDYHWELADGTGGRWFITVVDFDGGWRGTGRAAGLADLTAAMRVARILASNGLDFVLPPLAGLDGAEVASLDDRFAVCVFPYLDARAGRYDDPGQPGDRLALIDRLAALHKATAQVADIAWARDVVPASAALFEDTLSQLGARWPGPYGEACRALLAAHEPAIRRVLARFDRLVGEVTSSGTPLVVTHGEPHPGNLLAGAGHTWLIDWDTVGLAPAERDLWRLADGRLGGAGSADWKRSTAELAQSAELRRYADLTGHQVHGAAIELYQLRWPIDDLGLFIADIRTAQDQTTDAELAFGAVAEIVEDFATHG
jgi:spectinomycin phosphotransferase